MINPKLPTEKIPADNKVINVWKGIMKSLINKSPVKTIIPAKMGLITFRSKKFIFRIIPTSIVRANPTTIRDVNVAIAAPIIP